MLALNMGLALVWCALHGDFSPGRLLVGFILGWLVIGGSGLAGVTPARRYSVRSRRVVGFVFFFVWELLRANVDVAMEVLRPRLTITPGIVAVPLEPLTEPEIGLLTSLITLTPGTLSVEVTPDRSTLFVHMLNLPQGGAEAARHQIKEGFERRILRLVR